MTYRDRERERAVKNRNKLFNDPGDGKFFGKEREFVLADPKLNLWEGIREKAIDYFEANKIQWWNGSKVEPTGHLLSSQVACVNHLFPLRNRQDLATAVLQSIDPMVKTALIVDNGYVEFEFIGDKQYLQEKGFTRGANCTSIDAAMIGELENGERCLYMIEWKYTESYAESNLSIPERKKVYDHHIAASNSPFKVQTHDAYYFEPFYQLMRQTLLGWLLSQNRDHNCSQYRHIHVVPDKNTELIQKVTSPLLRQYGQTISDVWRAVLVEPELFISISPDKLLGPLSGQKGDDAALQLYLRERYW